MKMLVVAPHLSTGGMPQYLLKYLEIHKVIYSQIKVVEFSNFSSEFVVQKNKIKSLIGEENLITLGDYPDWQIDHDLYLENRMKLLDIIEEFQPDIVYMSGTPECYEYKLPPDEVMGQVYKADRKYKIIETNHTNSFDFLNKKYIPDEFMFCSPLHMDKTKHIDVPKIIWECPIIVQDRPDRDNVLGELGLDPSYLHILNVGLMNPNKNQKYIFDLAKKFRDKKVQFHFVGNKCFLKDCGILSEDIAQKNCKIWGERNDVDRFMSCMDIYLFPSKKELNPLTIKEALSWNMEVIASEDKNYTHQYKEYSNFHLIEDINVEEFIKRKYETMEIVDEISHNSLSEEEYAWAGYEKGSSYSNVFDVEDGDVVVDLGACIGMFSMEAIKKNIKKCYCIEPSKLHMEDLKINITDDRCVIVNKAIGNKNERRTFGFYIGERRDEEIDIVTLKHFAETYGIDKIDFLKMDIEGYEFDIFSHQESYDWIKNNVNKIAGELHLLWSSVYDNLPVVSVVKSDLRNIFDKLNKDFILNIVTLDGVDITDLFINNSDLINGDTLPWDYYTEVIFYAKNKKDIRSDVMDDITKIEGKFLMVCSMYNQTKDHILQTFKNVMNQTHDNWLLIVGDDFSDNGCGEMLKEEVKKINHKNIIHYDVKFKRELHLSQNFFKGIKYDYFLMLDADDFLSENLLEIYDYHFRKYPNVFSIYCDYEAVSESGVLERMSVIKKSDMDVDDEFHSRNGLSYYGLWQKYHSWNMFGHARCFRKSSRDKFVIKKNCPSSTDACELFHCLYEGDHLSLPRNLYKLTTRENSCSSTTLSPEVVGDFNTNTIFAIEEYSKNKKYKIFDVYDDVWFETSALSYSNITKNNNKINLISNINDDQLSKIKSLYYDKDIVFNKPFEDNMVIVWNKFNETQKIEILQLLKDKAYNFSIYYFLDDFSVTEDGMEEYFNKSSSEFFDSINKCMKNYSYFNYFRHIIISKEK